MLPHSRILLDILLWHATRNSQPLSSCCDSIQPGSPSLFPRKKSLTGFALSRAINLFSLSSNLAPLPQSIVAASNG